MQNLRPSTRHMGPFFIDSCLEALKEVLLTEQFEQTVVSHQRSTSAGHNNT